MARGKYSPTVVAAYQADQEWWHKFSREAEAWTLYDPEGFDSYGYNKDDVDRAGNHENDYLHDDGADLGMAFNSFNYAYDAALDAWGFDGEKPVLKRHKDPYSKKITDIISKMNKEGCGSDHYEFAARIVAMCADAADMAKDCKHPGDYVAEQMGFGVKDGVTAWRTQYENV